MPESRWSTGELEIQTMLDRGELEEVQPSGEHAALLLKQAETHLGSAPALIPADPEAAFAVAYDAARKSLSAVLAKQGLRATNKNGHRATQDAIEAQLGASRSVIRPFRFMRVRRHDVEYPALDTAPVTVEEVRDTLTDAAAIVQAMRKLLPVVGPW